MFRKGLNLLLSYHNVSFNTFRSTKKKTVKNVCSRNGFLTFLWIPKKGLPERSI